MEHIDQIALPPVLQVYDSPVLAELTQESAFFKYVQRLRFVENKRRQTEVSKALALDTPES